MKNLSRSAQFREHFKEKIDDRMLTQLHLFSIHIFGQTFSPALVGGESGLGPGGGGRVWLPLPNCIACLGPAPNPAPVSY